MTEQTVSVETLSNFCNSLTALISEYLHYFRDNDHKLMMIRFEVIDDLRKNIMDYMKSVLDGTVELILIEQRRKPE